MGGQNLSNNRLTDPMLSSEDRALCAARPNVIAYDKLETLHYLGNYTRRLPVNLARMMENAYDWEHLPYIHASSFSTIDLVDSGTWGWRAKLGLPQGGEQLLDLLVDLDRHYWATTVFAGAGEGVQIHTQATAVSESEIDIDVRFYLPERPEDDAAAIVLSYLQQQYATLYDEDVALMSGRQSALDDAKRRRTSQQADTVDEIAVGPLAELDRQAVHNIETTTGRMCVRHWQDQWIAHSAACPHLLGPLDGAQIDDQGHITCPWHGYRFDVMSGNTISTGDNKDGQCRALTLGQTIVRDGILYLKQTA